MMSNPNTPILTPILHHSVLGVFFFTACVSFRHCIEASSYYTSTYTIYLCLSKAYIFSCSVILHGILVAFC